MPDEIDANRLREVVDESTIAEGHVPHMDSATFGAAVGRRTMKEGIDVDNSIPCLQIDGHCSGQRHNSHVPLYLPLFGIVAPKVGCLE